MPRRKSELDVYQVQVKGERRGGADTYPAAYRLREELLRENPDLDPKDITIKTGWPIVRRPARG